MYAQGHIGQLLSGGLSCSQVVHLMEDVDIRTCRQSVWRLKQHINTLMPLSKSERLTILPDDVLRIIDNAMAQEDETTTQKLVTAYNNQKLEIRFLLLKGCRLLGWTPYGTIYCQLIYAHNGKETLLGVEKF